MAKRPEPLPEPEPVPSRRRGTRLYPLLGGLAAMLVLGGLGWAAWFHHAYGSFPGFEVGDRITWCGQDYRQSVTDLTAAEADVDPANPLRPLFTYPPVLPQATVYAAPRTPAELRADPALPCAPELYLRVANDRWTRYLPTGTE